MTVVTVSAAGYAVAEPPMTVVSSTPAGILLSQIRTTLGSSSYLVFVGLTVWLIHSLICARALREPARLIRYGSALRALVGDSRRSLRFVLAGEGLTVAAAGLVGLLRSAPPDASVDDTTDLLSAVAPVCAQALLILVVMFVVRLVVGAVALASRRTAGLVVAVVIVWVWGASSASGFVPPGVSDFRSYISVDEMLRVPARWLPVAVATVAVTATAVVTARWIDQRARETDRRQPRSAVDFAAAALAVTATTLILGTPAASLASHYDLALRGPGATVLQALTGIVTYAGYAFLFQFRINEQLGGWGALNLIRHGSLGRFLWRIARGESRRVAAYTLWVAAIPGLVFVLSGGGYLDGGRDRLVPMLVQLLLVTFLQLMFYVVVVISAITLSSNALGGLVACGVITAVAFAPFDSSSLFPIQRASMLNVQTLGVPLHNALVVAVALVVVSGALGIAARLHLVRLGEQL